MNELQKRFEESTKQKAFVNPVCHGEMGFASYGYHAWLEERVIFLERENEELKKESPCTWSFDSEGEYYDTMCGQAYTIIAGTPKDNGMKYCTYCGHPIVEIKTDTKEQND